VGSKIERRLVVDVGGGSTEFIVGAGLEPQLTESLYMGCVSYSLKYFPDGKVDKPAMRAAELAARQELAGIVRAYRPAGWAERVKQIALTIYEALTPGAERDDDADRLMLEWAARLVEIGLSIAHAQYHKHSAYVLSNADMPGFSRPEQARLARIVLAHRGKLSKVQDAGLDGSDWKLVFALRTASLILRNRSDMKLPFLRVAADAGGFAIDLPQSWVEDNPLSAAELEEE